MGCECSAPLKQLTPQQIGEGLKEALKVACEKAIKQLSAANGFLGNPNRRIRFPEEIKKVTDALARVPIICEKVEEVQVNMNRAAESATASALECFVKAVTAMTFADAKGILKGADDAATQYLIAHCRAELHKEFTPIVRARADELKVVEAFDSCMDKYGSMPFCTRPQFGFVEYVVTKTLDAIFDVIKEGEKDIRKNPAARTSALLKDVFA